MVRLDAAIGHLSVAAQNLRSAVLKYLHGEPRGETTEEDVRVQAVKLEEALKTFFEAQEKVPAPKLLKKLYYAHLRKLIASDPQSSPDRAKFLNEAGLPRFAGYEWTEENVEELD